MKKTLRIFYVLISILGFGSVAFALPYFQSTQTLIPFTNNQWDIGTSTAVYRNAYITQLCLSADCRTVWPAYSGTTGQLPYFSGTNTLTATSSIFLATSGNVGIGTTTPQWLLNPYSATAPQLALSAGAGLSQWAMRNAGGNLYFATTTTDGTATTTTSALTILNNGNVGIGTAAPSGKLHVSGSETTAYVSSSASAIEPSGGVNTYIQNTGNISNSFATLRFLALNGSNAEGYLGFVNDSGNQVTGSFVFGQRTGANSYAEQMRINNAGNVGIGTASPNVNAYPAGSTVTTIQGTTKGILELSSSAADASGNTAGVIDFDATANTSGAVIARQTVQTSGATALNRGGTWQIQTKQNGANVFNTGMFMDNSGNVGIGTTTPMSPLAVNGNQSSVSEDTLNILGGAQNNGLYTGIKIWNNAGTDSVALRNVVGTTGLNRFGLFLKDNAGNSETERLTVTSAGNVGIGTTSPAQLLSVAGNGYLTGGLGVGTTETTAGNITGTGRLSVTSTTATSTFSTGGLTVGTSQFVVQQTSGNVGIGITPAYKLDIAGAVRSSSSFFVNNDGGAIYVQNSTPTFVGGFGTWKWQTGNTNVSDMALVSNQNMGIFTNNSATPSVYINTSGNVGIGTTGPTGKLHVIDATQYADSSASEGAPIHGVSTYAGTGSNIAVFENTNASGGSQLDIFTQSSQATALQARESLVSGAVRSLLLNPVGGNVGIGTTTPYSKFHVTAGASATTTVNFGEVGSSGSHACFNTKNTAGTDVSFYIVGTTIVVENNLCK